MGCSEINPDLESTPTNTATPKIPSITPTALRQLMAADSDSNLAKIREKIGISAIIKPTTVEGKCCWACAANHQGIIICAKAKIISHRQCCSTCLSSPDRIVKQSTKAAPIADRKNTVVSGLNWLSKILLSQKGNPHRKLFARNSTSPLFVTLLHRWDRQ